MKKIFFILLCFLSSVYFVKAASLESEILPYYVIISKNGSEPQLINVKKIYNQETLDVLFNVDINYYEVNNNFNIYSKYSFENWKINKNSIPYFNTVTYYGYLKQPSDLNYFLTQVLLWTRVFGYKVEITDVHGNPIDDYKNEYVKIIHEINNHITQPSFFNKTYDLEIWSNKEFKYRDGIPVLDNPKVKDLIFSNKENTLNIYSKKVGSYFLTFTKDYEEENYSYNDGVNFYLQNLKGPRDLGYSMMCNVYGIKFNVVENLIGINNHLGDASLNSKYELYLDGELKLVIEDLNDLYVKSNSNYLLKDISNTKGIKNIDDISFEVLNEEYILNINKYVIRKNVGLNIKTNKTYYVHLKSNNELYEIIDNSTDLIILPYGVYYIKDENNTYYKEIIVDDEINEVLTIQEEEIEEPKNEEIDNEVIEVPEVEEETDEEDEIIYDNINNPQTLDEIEFYKFIFILSSCFLFLMFGLSRLLI